MRVLGATWPNRGLRISVTDKATGSNTTKLARRATDIDSKISDCTVELAPVDPQIGVIVDRS